MEKLEQILQPIKQEFDQCKSIYRSAHSEVAPLLNNILELIQKREGKMLRPILLLLCAKLFGNIDRKAINVAAAYEFFHTASLVHDDVVDESDERRGQPSVNSSYNNKRAVLAGDYILSYCLHYIASAGNPRLVDIISVAANSLSSGELLQLSMTGKAKSQEEYIEVIKNKTAALFAACAQSGAVVAGASEEDIEVMRRFGEALGIGFQIKDDLLDEEISLDEASPMLSYYTHTAKSLLSRYPDSTTRQSLEDFVDFVTEREY